MKSIKIETIKEPVSRYTLTQSLLNSLLNSLKNSIVENGNLIIDANKEDVRHNKKQIKIREFVDIIEKYKKQECILKDDERKIVIYKGDPYVTLHLCLQAITQRTKILLIQDSFMLGVNEILLRIIQEVLKTYKIFNLIEKMDSFSLNEFNNIKSFYDDTIVIGDTTIYQMLEENNDIKYYPYNNIALYCDSPDLGKLQEAIYIYANENEYELEIVYAENIDDAIEIINMDETQSIAILLTKDEKNKEIFFYEIKNKEIFVNENPFKRDVGKIYNYLK